MVESAGLRRRVVGEGQDFYRVDPPGECPVTGGDLPFVSLFTSIADGSGKGDNRPIITVPGGECER